MKLLPIDLMRIDSRALILCLMMAFFTIPSLANERAKMAAYSELIGISESELRIKYPEVRELSNSFKLLLSKNLFPYQPPETHKFLRLGNQYIVFELKDDVIIKVHKVSG